MRKNNIISTLLKVSMLLVLFTVSKLSFSQPCDPKWNRGKSSNCENSPIYFESNAGGYSTHLWDFGQGNTSTQVNPIFAYNVPGSYIVTYTGTNTAGGKCTDTINLVIKESPRVKTIALTPLSQCFLGNKFCFIDSTKPARAIAPDPISKLLTIRYLFSDGALYTINDPKGGDTICHTVVDPNGGFFDLTIEAEDYNGCITKVFYSKFIRVFPKIGVQFKSVGPNSCDSVRVTVTNLTDTFTKLNQIAKFMWDFGYPGSDNNIIIGDSVTNTGWWRGTKGVIRHLYDVSSKPSGTYIFDGKLTVTTVFGCTETFTFKSSATVNVLHVRIIAENDSDCVSTKDGLVEFTAVDAQTGVILNQLKPPPKITSFLWTFGDPPSGPANNDKSTLIKAAKTYGLGPWMTSLNLVSGPCNITVLDTIFKIGPTSTIEVPFNRVPEDEKYQCIIRDTVHFVNNSSFYHVDDISVSEDSSRVYNYYTLKSKGKIGYWEKPLTLDTIRNYGTYQGKSGITTIFYLEKDTLESITQSALEPDSIIYYVQGKKVKKAVTKFIISGKDTLEFSKQKEYAFKWPGDQTAIKSVFPPAQQRHKEHALRLWTFGDNYAPKCTTDTKRNRNVGLNCNFSYDSLPQHWYTPWEDLYKYYRSGQFYSAAAEKTVLCKGGRFCYKVKYYPQMSYTIPADTLLIVPKDSTFKFFGKYTITPATPEKFTGTLRIKKVPSFIAGVGSYVPTVDDEKWRFKTPTSIVVKDIKTGNYSTRNTGVYTMKNMADQFQLLPELTWRTFNYSTRRFDDSSVKSKVSPFLDSFVTVKSKLPPFKDSIIKSRKPHTLVYAKFKHVHNEPLHDDALIKAYFIGRIASKGIYYADTSEFFENLSYLKELKKVFDPTKLKNNTRNIGHVTRFFLDKDTLETFYQKFDEPDSIIYYVSGSKVRKPITNPIISGRDTIVISEFRRVADSAFSIPQFIITAGRTINAQPTLICIDTIIGGRDTFVSRSRIFIDSSFHRQDFYAKNTQCNTVRLYHEDTVHSLHCNSTGNISLALMPPNGHGLKFEGIKCYAPPSPPFGMRFDVGETKPGCTQRLLKFNFDSAGGKNLWVSHGGFLAPPLPGSSPWHLGYQLSGAYPTQFVQAYTAGAITNRNPGWVTVGVVIGNGRWLDVAAPLDTIECIDTVWYHNAFRYLYLDGRFNVIVPEREQKSVCVGDTITFKLVDPLMDSVTQLTWSWNDDEGSYYEERTYYYQPYKGPNNNRNDRVIKDWKKTDKWRYHYVIRLEYDGFKYKTLDTIVTGIIRKWSIAANVSRAEVDLTAKFKQIQLVMSEIPASDLPLYFGNGTGKGCIDTSGIGSLISYGVAPYKDALTVHDIVVRKKSKLAPFGDSIIKSRIAPFHDSVLIYQKSLVNPLKDSIASVDFTVGDVSYRYTDFTRKDSTIISQKLHWRLGNQSGWDTLEMRVKQNVATCFPSPAVNFTLKSKVPTYLPIGKTKSKIPVYRDSTIYSKVAIYNDITLKSKVPVYKDSTVKSKLLPKTNYLIKRQFNWFWLWSRPYNDSFVTVKSKLPPFKDSIIKSKVATYNDSIVKSKVAVYKDSTIRGKKAIFYDSTIYSKVPVYGDSIRANTVTGSQFNPGVYRHAYRKHGSYYPTFQVRNTEGCFSPKNAQVIVGFYSKWTFSDSIVCHENSNIVLKEDIKYYFWQPVFETYDPRGYWKEPTRYINRRETKKIDFNEHDDSIIKSKIPQYKDSIININTPPYLDTIKSKVAFYCDSIIKNMFGVNGTGVPQFSYHYDKPGIYKIRIAMKDSMGCVDTAEQKVFVSGVVAKFKTLVSPKLACKNFVSFFDSSYAIDSCLMAPPLGKGKPCDKIIEYTWDFGDGKQQSKLQHPTHDFTQNGDFTITLIVKTQLGCKDTATFQIHIEGPRPYFSHMRDTIICVNDSVSFINESYKPFYTPSWVWNYGDGATGSSTQLPLDTMGHRYTKAGTYEVYLTQFDDIMGDPTHRCSAIYPDTSSDNVIKIKRLVIVKPVAPANFDIAPAEIICPNTELTFTSKSDTLYTRFDWKFGKGEDSIMMGGKVATHTYKKVGKYTITMIPDYDTPEFKKCLDTVKRTIEVVDVKAAFTIDPSGDPKFCFKNESVGATKYEWIFEEKVTADGTSDLQDPCYQWADTGCHRVTLKAINDIGCWDTTSQVICSTFVAIIIPYNVFTPEPKDGFNDVFRVKAQGLEEFDIVIYNRWGDIVFESKDPNFAWDGTIRNKGKIECPEGTYFYLMNYKIIGKPKNDGRKKPMSGTVTLIRGK